MNILVTAIGSMSALCVINRLHDLGHFVVGCDIYPKEWHYEASLCDVFYRAPYASNYSEYIAFLSSLIAKHKIDMLFPLTDLEIDVVNKFRSNLEQLGIKVCISSLNALSFARNKKSLYDLFKDDPNVPSIKTLTTEDDLSALSYPCIAKPKDGRSSEGLYVLQNKEQIVSIENTDRYIFQEKKEGPVCTVDYVRNPFTEEDFFVEREELIRTKNGAGVTVRLFNDKRLGELVSYVGQKVQVAGVVNMEFIRGADDYYLIDINPRFSAGVAFSCKIGYDFICAHINSFLNKSLPPKVEYEEKIMTKYYVE